MSETIPCPCQSGLDYDACCEPLIKGTRPAPDPEALMRARYTAFAMVEMPYLRDTLHPGQRDDYDEIGATAWARDSDWTGLDIINVSVNPKTDNSARHPRSAGTSPAPVAAARNTRNAAASRALKPAYWSSSSSRIMRMMAETTTNPMKIRIERTRMFRCASL